MGRGYLHRPYPQRERSELIVARLPHLFQMLLVLGVGFANAQPAFEFVLDGKQMCERIKASKELRGDPPPDCGSSGP